MVEKQVNSPPSIPLSNTPTVILTSTQHASPLAATVRTFLKPELIAMTWVLSISSVLSCTLGRKLDVGVESHV